MLRAVQITARKIGSARSWLGAVRAGSGCCAHGEATLTSTPTEASAKGGHGGGGDCGHDHTHDASCGHGGAGGHGHGGGHAGSAVAGKLLEAFGTASERTHVAWTKRGDEPISSDFAFEVKSADITFGRGAVHELGKELGATLRAARCEPALRVAVFTDLRVRQLEPFAAALDSLRASGYEPVVYDAVAIEPTDASFEAAGAFVAQGRFGAHVSIGGGSVIDTAKAGVLLGTYPHAAGLQYYLNKPIGQGGQPPGPLPVHLAVPTTAGTGAECTGFAVCDLLASKSKTAINSKAIRPAKALVDPWWTDSLPAPLVAASGFDVLAHALESYTARHYSQRALDAGSTPRTIVRPLNQGRNPFTDTGCLAALDLCARYLVRAVTVPGDQHARDQMMFAATLAGTAMGGAGVHLAHGLSYPVSGWAMGARYTPGEQSGYPPGEPMIPHGMAVMLHAPGVFYYSAATSPDRHRVCLMHLLRGRGAPDAEIAAAVALNDPQAIGATLAIELVRLMRATKVCPSGLAALGLSDKEIPDLVARALPQRRVLDNAPFAVTAADLTNMYMAAMHLW